MIRYKYKLEFDTFKVDDLLDPEKYHENEIFKYYASWGYIKKYLMLELALNMMRFNPSSRIALIKALLELTRIENTNSILLMVQEFQKRRMLFPY